MKNYLITGGAGFIGSVYASRLLDRGDHVTIYDNLSRRGCELNLAWLYETYGEYAFTLVTGELTDRERLEAAVKETGPDVIAHLAAQVAVTTSVHQPRLDFESNALGTFNVLEAARQAKKTPIVLYASTNKVYGGMETLRVEEGSARYSYADMPFGIPEEYPLDFHSPYGCSKGAGDQYVRDYHRIFDLPTVVFRQSCIYGPRQFGVEDQGWVAWFIIATLTSSPITVYGDGKQVRDVLFVEDLLDVYDRSVDQIDSAAGQVYNIGGGPDNTLAIWSEFGPILERLHGKAIPVEWSDWRPGDQRIFVSDIRKATQELGWQPNVGVEEGIARLFEWASKNRELFKQFA